MIPSNSTVYLETSAINYFKDLQDARDALATRTYHQLKGTRFVVSPVAISEILVTTDEIRREQLIYHLQHLADRILLCSPAEIGFNYIKAGCPIAETKYNLTSEIPMSAVFTDVIDHPNKTFIFNKGDVKNVSRGILEAFKYIQAVIERPGMTQVELTELQQRQLMLDAVLRQMKTIRYDEITEDEKKRFKLTLMLISVVLGYGIGFDVEFVDQFWVKLGIHDTAQRTTYLFKNFEPLIYRGPFAVMADTILSQLQQGRRPTRGIVWDALHSIYLIYTDWFATADKHFKYLRDDGEHFQYGRIVYLPEAKLFTAKEIKIIDPEA